jgi:MFS family permease
VENSPFLKSLLREGAGKEGAWEASISSLGQVAEIFVMLGLAGIIARLGFKWTITLGLSAYMIRCLMFVGADQLRGEFAAAMTVACLGQTLHGLCFACFMATAYIFIDRDTPAHVRGTAQNVYGTFVIGLGFFVGGIVTSEIAAYFTTGEGDSAVRNFTGIWLSGAGLAAACAVAFALLFPRQMIGSGVPAASPTPELDAHAEPAGAGE